MLEWFKQNKRLAFKILGTNFLLMAIVLLFWAQPKEGMSENEKAAANLARMEAKASGSSHPAASESSSFMQEYKEAKKAQLRVFLIIMIVCGVGFLGYGFFKKDE